MWNQTHYQINLSPRRSLSAARILADKVVASSTRVDGQRHEKEKCANGRRDKGAKTSTRRTKESHNRGQAFQLIEGIPRPRDNGRAQGCSLSSTDRQRRGVTAPRSILPLRSCSGAADHAKPRLLSAKSMLLPVTPQGISPISLARDPAARVERRERNPILAGDRDNYVLQG